MSQTGRRVASTAVAGSSGFTLLEMLVVLCIAAIAGSIALPYLGKTDDRTRVRAAARVLATDLRWLREQAIAAGRETKLVVESDQNRYVASQEGSTPSGRQTASRTRGVPPGALMTFSPPAAGTHAEPATLIRFFADGTSTGGRIELDGAGRHYAVSVSWPFGIVQVHE